MADVLSVIADVLNQDKKQKKEQAKMMREVQKKLKEKDSVEVAEEEGDKEDYMKFFAGKLKKYGVKSPAELSDEDKKKFFNEIETDWKHDSSEEVEVEEKEESLGKRVKARMEAEDEKEDEDEDPVGEPEEDDEPSDEPSEDEIEKIADLVVQKIKDKADDEEDEEEEPDPTEAEGGKEEKVEVNPKMEQVRNPHARNTWEAALRQVSTFSEESQIVESGHTDVASAKNQVKVAKSALQKMEMELNKLPEENALPSWWTNKVAIAVDKLDGMADYLDTQVEGVLIDEASDTSWIDPMARKIERKWKSMNKSARQKWLKTMAAKAEDEDTKQAVLDDVLDDYGLTEAYTDLGGAGEEGTTTSDTDKDYGLHQFSDPKYVPAYTDQSFQTAPDKTGIGQTPKPTQSGTPKKAKGQAIAAKTPAKVDAKTGQEKPAVGTKSDTPDKAVGKADSAKIAPRVTTKDGVATQKEEVELDERAKGDSIEGPAKGKKHKCPTYVKKEGYGYGKNISHSLSENVVDKMNIYWYDSKEVSFMMPTSEVEIVTESMHTEEGHTEKFKSTKKIAEELSKLPNPFETAPTTEVKTIKKIVTEKRSVSFARKFYQKGEK
jgi:hypothetical protein